MEVIDLFQRRDTRDELGVGAIRDSIADLLAPGISTIQTRARYLLFIPWIYQRLERRRTRSADIGNRAREDELRLARALANSKDSQGTIGIEAGSGLKRLPSNVYWSGLGQYGIRLFPGSWDQYHRSLDRFYRDKNDTRAIREDPEVSIYQGANWHPHLPKAPDNFLDDSGFALTSEEAVYLQDRMLARVSSTLLSFLVERGATWDEVGYPWEEPLYSACPGDLRTLLDHARSFSEVMHGAALLYNLMLAEMMPNEEWISDYHGELEKWLGLLSERADELKSWNRSAFWQMLTQSNAQIPAPTRSFAESWIDIALDSVSTGNRVANNSNAARLIADRELYPTARSAITCARPGAKKGAVAKSGRPAAPMRAASAPWLAQSWRGVGLNVPI